MRPRGGRCYGDDFRGQEATFDFELNGRFAAQKARMGRSGPLRFDAPGCKRRRRPWRGPLLGCHHRGFSFVFLSGSARRRQRVLRNLGVYQSPLTARGSRASRIRASGLLGHSGSDTAGFHSNLPGPRCISADSRESAKEKAPVQRQRTGTRRVSKVGGLSIGRRGLVQAAVVDERLRLAGRGRSSRGDAPAVHPCGASHRLVRQSVAARVPFRPSPPQGQAEDWRSCSASRSPCSPFARIHAARTQTSPCAGRVFRVGIKLRPKPIWRR